MIYLDYSANTPVSEDVLRCFCETEREFFGNPNSTHDAGKAARKRMDEVTVSIAGLMGAAPEEIIYTSCASESNNTALKGIAALARSRGMHIISTAVIPPFVVRCRDERCPNMGLFTYMYALVAAARESRNVGHVSHVCVGMAYRSS